MITGFDLDIGKLLIVFCRYNNPSKVSSPKAIEIPKINFTFKKFFPAFINIILLKIDVNMIIISNTIEIFIFNY